MDTTQGLQGLKIALLIDFDNVILGVDEPGFDVELVVNALRSRGIVVLGRAYGDWYRHHRHRRKLMEQGIELVETPVFGPLIKNSADIRIVLDAFEIAMSQGHIDAFCLVSGDSDFLPLIKKLQYLGKTVVVIAGNKFTSDLVRRNCNEFVSYENLLAESVGATEDVSVLEGAYQLLDRTINTLHERGMDVRSSTVKQMMLQLNPAFSERTFGCTQFKQFLDKAQRAGIIKLDNRDGASGEFSVLLPSDLEPLDAEATGNGVAKEAGYRNGARTQRPDRDRRTYAERRNFSAPPSTPGKVGPPAEARTDNTTPPNGTPDESALITSSGTDGNILQPTEESARVTPGTNGGPIPASTFLNRGGLRRGRLRFSGKNRRDAQGAPIEQGAQETADATAASQEETNSVEATLAEAIQTAPASEINTPVSEDIPAPASADDDLPEMLADEEAVAKSLPKRRPTRNQRRKKAEADKSKTSAKTPKEDVSDESVTVETLPVETVPAAADVTGEAEAGTTEDTNQDKKSSGASTAKRSATAEASVSETAKLEATAEQVGEPTSDGATVPTVDEPEALMEESAKKPTRRRRSTPRKKAS